MTSPQDSGSLRPPSLNGAAGGVREGLDGGVRPSPIFVLIVAATAGLVFALYTQNVSSRLLVFGLVVVGWILSLTLHEFAHAYTAWRGGDHTVESKGYLQLDPTKYTNFMLSLAMPVLFLLMGGIGFPGGAVWIQRNLIRTPVLRSLMSLAGPAANLAFAALCLVPIGVGLVNIDDHYSLTVALGFLGALQIGAVLLNMMPIPGFDGYGAIDPFLSNEIRRAVAPVGQYGFFIIIGLFFLYPPAGRIFWDIVSAVANFLGGDGQVGPGGDPAYGSALRGLGWREFRFWESR